MLCSVPCTVVTLPDCLECGDRVACPNCAAQLLITHVQDQLKLEMAAGRTFVHLQEAPITFRPTYKFDKHSQVGLWPLHHLTKIDYYLADRAAALTSHHLGWATK